MDDSTSTTKTTKSCMDSCTSLTWWAMLVVAVLAIPSMAIIIASILPVRGFFQLSIFIVSCWICTYLGMMLMKRPHNPK